MSIKQGDYLKQLRIVEGLSQEKLSEELGISRQSISKWEQGLSSPDVENLKKLSEFFGVSVDSLLNGEPDAPKPDPADEPIANIPDMTMFNATKDSVIKSSNYNLKDTRSIKDVEGLDMPEPPAYTDDEQAKRIELDANLKEDKAEAKPKKHRGWLFPSYPVIAVIIYCLIGTIFKADGWKIGWTVLLTIPLFYTGVIAFEKKKPVIFCYPVLVVMIFMLLGLCASLWHPTWILFLTIPIYYIAAAKMGKRNKE